jgi:hypothetical protein
VPFIELSRTPYLRELDFGWLRIHIKIDWRPKGWNEAEHQAQLNQRLARILESPFLPFLLRRRDDRARPQEHDRAAGRKQAHYEKPVSWRKISVVRYGRDIPAD